MANYNILTDIENKGTPTLELVLWEDHSSLDKAGWLDLADVIERLKEDALVIYSVGWVVYEDATKVIMISSTDKRANSINVDGDQCILKGTIVERHVLKDPTNPKTRGSK